MAELIGSLLGSAIIPLILIVKAITNQTKGKKFSGFLIASAVISVMASAGMILEDVLNGGIKTDSIIALTVMIGVTAIGFIACYTRKIK